MSVFWIYQRTHIFFYFCFFLHHHSTFYSSTDEKYATTCTQIPSIFRFCLLPALSSLPVLGLIILFGVYSHVSFLIVINPQAICVNTYCGTYLQELKKKKKSSLSQKTLAKTSPAEVCTSFFFCVATPDDATRQWVVMMNPSFTIDNYS